MSAQGITENDVVTEPLEPIITDQEDRELRPLYVSELEAKSGNDSLTHRSLCGDTEIEDVGEEEWHITIEGGLLKRQVETLKAMRPATNKLDIVSDIGTYRGVSFDTVIIKQSDQDNTIQTRFDGQEIVEPLIQFQLQSRDDST